MTDKENKSAREMFEEWGFKCEKECYEHPLMYNKKRKKNDWMELGEDSFAFYKKEKTITIWKDNNIILLNFKELEAINKQVSELGLE